MEKRNLLAYLSVKFNGDAEKISEAVSTISSGLEAFEIDADAVNSISDTAGDFIAVGDSDYPSSLDAVRTDLKPWVVFTKGDKSIMSKPVRIAVIGSVLSNAGMAAADKFLEGVASSYRKDDVAIVTGVAKGAMSHIALKALQLGLPVIGVLASGRDMVYPPDNTEVAMLYGGLDGLLLVTSLPDGVAAKSSPDAETPFNNYGNRNILLNGLSTRLVAVDVMASSCSMYLLSSSIFIRPALTYGLELAGDDVKRKTVNKLIAQGYIGNIQSADDVIDGADLRVIPPSDSPDSGENASHDDGDGVSAPTEAE